MKNEPLIGPKRLIFPAVLAAIAVLLSSTGYASDRHAKSKSKSKAMPTVVAGPEWADTNHDGQLSDAELKRAIQLLEQKNKELKTDSTKVAASAGPVLPDSAENGQLSDKAREEAEAKLKNQFGKYLDGVQKKQSTKN